jgi:thermitase
MVRRELRRKAMGVRVLPQHLAITGALALALCLMGLLGAASSKQANALEAGAYKPNQVIVKLLPNVEIGKINADYDTKILDNALGGMDVYLLRTPADKDVTTFARRLARDPLGTRDRVLYAEPNFLTEAPEEDPYGDARMRARSISTTRTSESGSSDRLAAKNLGLLCAAGISKGNGVKVAVLDTGAQLDHTALKTNFERVKDYDFVGNDTNPSEPRRGSMVGHGTHVAGIVDRVAPEAKIMPLRVLNARGSGNVFTIAKAISFAWRNEADVINLSLGASSHSKLLEEMIKTAISKNVVVVAAAGNSNTNRPHYPAAGDEILTVASTDGLIAVTSVTYKNGYDKKSWFANYGTWVDIAAPGEDIRSAFPVDKYANWSGTSMATPFVSGQAALIHKVYGSLDPVGIERRIHNTDRDFVFDPDDALSAWTLPGQLGTGYANVCASLGG